MALTSLVTEDIFLLLNNSYNKLLLCNEKLKICRRHYFKVASATNSYNAYFKRQVNSESNNKNFKKFEQYLLYRKEQAHRTVVIQIQSVKSLNDLSNYCIKFGNINGIYHYVSYKNMHCALVEFDSINNVKDILSEATHINFDSIIPVHSNFLWFRNNVLGQKKQQLRNISNKHFKIFKNSTKIHSEQELANFLNSAETVSDQILVLYNLLKLNDVETRLRFVTANQLERSLSSLFPNVAVLPFGSSVNGFGKQGCDLDLVMNLGGNKKENENTRLVYHAKSTPDERIRSKNCMETIADTMQYLMPCIANVRRILNARVPIIKYAHLMSGLECDLSMTNMTAIYMTELLFLFGEIDWRVRPLVFSIRKWANAASLTNSNAAGPWITNFPLTLLVLFYLQQKNILPTLKQLKDLADKDDIRIADYHIDCTFVRDVTKIEHKQYNKESLAKLLLDFFQFYMDFDFATRAISIKEGKSVIKPDYSPLYICNPLETSLNVSKNMNAEEVQRLCIAFRNSAWLLESAEKVNTGVDWGLVKIYNRSVSNKSVFNQVTKNSTVQINMEELLKNDEDGNELKSTNRKLSQVQNDNKSLNGQ